MINKYIQIYYNNIWYLGYITLNKTNRPYIWFTNKEINNNKIYNLNKINRPYKWFTNKEINNNKIYNLNKIIINNIEYNFMLFEGHLYLIYLISSNKLFYHLPIEIRKLIWDYINLNTL